MCSSVYTMLIPDYPRNVQLICTCLPFHCMTVSCNNPNPTISCLERNYLLKLAPLPQRVFLLLAPLVFRSQDLETDFSKK